MSPLRPEAAAPGEGVSWPQAPRSRAVDVYDAVTWSSVFPLSAESVQRGGQPVAIPDFRRSKR